MGEFVGIVLELLDINSNVVSWVTLIFNVESQTLHFLDDSLKLLIVVSYEDTVVYVDHENDVTAEEYTVIY